MVLAAMAGNSLNRCRFSQKKFQNWEGMVKVMCCQVVFGRTEEFLAIQTSVDFLPQEEQKRDLHE